MRETILLDALEEIKNYKAINQHIGAILMAERATKALTDWASAPKEGLQWVNASERLPKRDGWVHIRNTDTNPSTIYYKVGDYMPPSFKWLDESSAPESGGEETWKSIDNPPNERFHVANLYMNKQEILANENSKEIERLTAENEGNKTIAIERGKGIEELQGEIERLKGLIEKAIKKHTYPVQHNHFIKQFFEENGLTNEKS